MARRAASFLRSHEILTLTVLYLLKVTAFSPKFRFQRQTFSRPLAPLATSITTSPVEATNDRPRIVLVAGFESFNRDLYEMAAKDLDIDLRVFSDADIRRDNASQGEDDEDTVNPDFREAVTKADAFIGSLIFDYDDALAVSRLLPAVKEAGPRLVFESATEVMAFNRVGTFSMMKDSNSADDKNAGPPPAIKAVLSKFGSGKEEDKLNGYLQLLKIGPSLLKFVPGNRARDIRIWLEAYRYWNQGGPGNVRSMLQLIADQCRGAATALDSLPALQVTPDVALVHPLRYNYIDGTGNTENPYLPDPASYMRWRLSESTKQLANEKGFTLATDDSPRVAILLYRKHVITELRYILDLITMMEKDGLIPLPIFINGVEAHTIVRDILTSEEEVRQVNEGKTKRDATFRATEASTIDAIVNTVGFPLVGGPAGSMQAGRNVDVAEKLLSDMNVPYIVASPLLLQSIPQWKDNGVLGLQSVVLYSLPELDGAVDTVVLGGLVGDRIALVPERVRKLNERLHAWVGLRRTPKQDRNIAVALYGFPPNVGAVGTAALLDVPSSLETVLRSLHEEGYDVGSWFNDPDASGESIVAALATLCEDSVVTAGASLMQSAVDNKILRAQSQDQTVPVCLSKKGGGLGGATVRAQQLSYDDLEHMIGPYMTKKVRKAWPASERGPGTAANGDLVVAGLQIGNVFLFVQPLLGLEGDPMRLLFERDLTPHPQYCATYAKLNLSEKDGGFGTDAIVHFGMHGTVEWLPGQPLGNDRQSWSDQLLGKLPNMYVYAANNPSESILAKRRGYGTIVSYNVPPYGRAGLYLELANLKELVDECRAAGELDSDVLETVHSLAKRCGMLSDVPFPGSQAPDELPEQVSNESAFTWLRNLNDYLMVLQDRLFSSGLHVFGQNPSDEEVSSYLDAYFGDRLTDEQRNEVISNRRRGVTKSTAESTMGDLFMKTFTSLFQGKPSDEPEHIQHETNETYSEAVEVIRLLSKTTEEVDSLLVGLSGGYIRPAAGGDLLRDGPSVLPTGRNIHALDPYRLPSPTAWIRGQKAAREILRQHQAVNNGDFPETVAVTLWGLDSIKTRGESVAIVLALVGAVPVKEGTGRIVRYDLMPLDKLGRPRVDVLCSLSGIFRDSFANIVDLLDDMFERAGSADEPAEMNFVKKHVLELEETGVKDRASARLFSNPPGDYGSMVNEVVGSGDWEESESLGETWRGRNVFSYGRNEGSVGSAGTARPEVLDKLLTTTERVVQEIDSVEYGLSDIQGTYLAIPTPDLLFLNLFQEYYANTGALKKAAENRKELDESTGRKRQVTLSIIEAFGGGGETDSPVEVKDVEEVLRLEYRSKLLNPKWRDAMLEQGSGGAYEISQRMTAMIGWSATASVDKFVFDQAFERYAMDDGVAEQLQKANPEAFKNVIRRLLEAAGRGMWTTDDDTLNKLRELYGDADDMIEQGTSQKVTAAGV